MTPEEIAARKAKRRERLANMSPEEREALKAKNKARRQERLANMSPEELEALKAKKRQRW